MILDGEAGTWPFLVALALTANVEYRTRLI
jgi:hypothetical protein